MRAAISLQWGMAVLWAAGKKRGFVCRGEGRRGGTSPTDCQVRYRGWWRALAAAVVLGVALDSHAGEPDTLRVGSVDLHRCQTTAPWCAELVRPLDPSGVVAGSVAVYFEFFPHTAPGPSQGMLVGTEGGPGFPATESRDEFLDLFKPLRGKRDVVLMDNRGTGRSAAIDCRPLQIDPTLTEINIARCGLTLGPEAPLYSAALAADDLAAILEALASGPIDLYGDSYGTFFEQVFAVRHPDKLRSLILDGAYPLDAKEYAWYPNYAPAMRAKFNLACERSEDCSRLPGSSMDHIAPVLAELRKEPVAAHARDGDGRLRKFRADPTQLATVMFGSAPAYASVRELDAAARAYLRGDRAPLFRLMAETQVDVDSRDPTKSRLKFSVGLAVAVTCEDAPQIFDMSLDPERRSVSRDAEIAQRKLSAPDTYAPFTIDEYRGMPLDYSFIDECARWPAAEPKHAASVADIRMSAYPEVPALVISGDLDNMTPVADGALVAKKFPRGRQIVVPNGFHVNALAHSRSGCLAELSRRFIETLDVGDTSCLQSVPEVRLVPEFARRVEELPPARAINGNGATQAQLRIVTAAVLTVGDAIARVSSNSVGRAWGLRGGSFDISETPEAIRLTLYGLQWVENVGVSGKVTGPRRAGGATADIAVIGPAGNKGTLHVRWIEGEPRARARVTGKFGDTAVVAETPAP